MEGLGLKYVFGKQLKGWLRQHMGMMRGSPRLFFVLDSGRLSCLTREDDVLAQKTYILKDCELKESSKSADCSFELITDKEQGESVTLRAANEEERKEWVKALRYVIYGDTGGGVFGVPLEELMKHESKEGRSVPYIVEACVNHLELNAKETEGIFRMPGRVNMVKELRGKFEMGYRPVLDSVDVHTVGSLLKSYLRDLPESLIPPSSYQKAMNFALRYSDATTVELQTIELTGLSKFLKELPCDSYATLAYICQFLHDMTANSEKTKMNSHNLSLVFGPNLIRHMDDNPQLMMVTTDLTQQLAYMFIHHCQFIFSASADQEASQSEATGDRPVMRKKKSSQDNVPTADLLDIFASSDSQTDARKSARRPTALCDLMGVDFSVQQEEVFVDPSSAPSTSPFVVIDQFEACGLGAEDGSTSSETSGGTGCLEMGSTSGPGLGSKPIPPRRTKTRTLKRNQQLSDFANSSPSKTDAPSQLVSESTRMAPTLFSTAQHLPEDKADKSVSKYNVGIGMSTALDNGSTHDLSAKCHSARNRDEEKDIKNIENYVLQGDGCCDDLATSTAVGETVTLGMGSMTLGPSQTELESEVLTLKTELVSLKSQYDCQVSSLKSQLNSMRCTFEEKIADMEREHGLQLKDLRARLAVENKARAEAVNRTVNLQAELYRYKLQYGDIQGSK